ncbi:uncharacterized protein N7482_007359 [Penicillium canariense]|uniref:Uncharacterized protein n=1 Tax=Penicillium canariense TaxID=189055 RepID=A0A9W9LJS6_9EURO|nr:uncharacterized protein N7482_007359 [Penicillium canariense]KAJ5160355.1 hypothetical protein N7482_007359 [Penicillium canariense]
MCSSLTSITFELKTREPKLIPAQFKPPFNKMGSILLLTYYNDCGQFVFKNNPGRPISETSPLLQGAPAE